jgi:uncharacterized protein
MPSMRLQIPDNFFARIAPYVMLLAALAVPLLLYGVRGALQGGNNDVRQWLPSGFLETRQYDWFLDQFGSEEVAVVSWPGCTIDDERLDKFAAAIAPYVEEQPLQKHAVVEHADGQADAAEPLFRRILTTRQAIEQLTAEPMNVPRDEAIRRLTGLLIGPDGQTAAALVKVNEAGAADRKRALATVYEVAKQVGLERNELRLAGPTVDSVALDSESQRSRYLLAAISLVVALVLAWRCLRHVRLVAIVFSTALLCAAANVALVYFLGGTMNLLLGMMPTLVFLLAISGAIHLVNYYRDAVRQGRVEEAPLLAVKAAFWPCLLSAGTTAVGLGSLVLSEVMPVRTFGFFTAIGVLTSLPILYVFLPSALHLWPAADSGKSSGKPLLALPGTGSHWTEPLAGWLIRHHRWVLVGGLGLLAWTGSGLLKLDTSVKLLNLFSSQSRIIQDYTWLEQQLGPMVPLEVVLRFAPESPLSMLDRMQLVRQIEQELESIEKVGGTMSAATFAPNLPVGGGARQITQRVILQRNLERHREHFADMHYLRSGEQGELWRISARVEALNTLDYGLFVERLREQVQPVLVAVEESGRGEIEATYTGVIPLIYKAQRTLLNDLRTSFLTAFVLIAGVMIVLLRGAAPGLISMLSNVFPAVTMFGAMGLSGMLLDIGSMMTAGAALGIAVDDTIHFLTWFRRGLNAGLSRPEAIKRAYAHCAPAMIQTSIICGLGLMVFAFSAFVPTARFAWLMAAMLGMALVGDLVFLPALLASPLGRFFERGRPTERDSDPVAESVVPETKAATLPTAA